jgi:hypothetical protein
LLINAITLKSPVEDLKKGISKPLKEMNFSSGDEDASINSNYQMPSSTSSLLYNKRNSIGNRDEDDEEDFDDEEDDEDDDPIS